MNKDSTVSRRDFFKAGAQSIASIVADVAGEFLPTLTEESVSPILLRPPGALPETEFVARCTRCDACVTACPRQSIIKFVSEEAPLHLTPMLTMRRSPCVWCNDFPCVRACEPKALVAAGPAIQMKIGTAVINRSLCYAWQGQDCDYCVKECPFTGSAIAMDADRRPRVSESDCTGCGLCEYICPSRQAAIIVVKRERQ